MQSMELKTDAQDRRSSALVVSLLFAAAAAYVLFVLFLQTPVISQARLALAILVFIVLSSANSFACVRWALRKLVAGERAWKAIPISLILAGIFLPLLYQAPGYPESPLLRPWSEVAVEFKLNPQSQPAALPFQDVRLVMGKEALNAQTLQLVGDWKPTASGLALSAGSTGSLQYAGTVPETTTLAIQPPKVDGTLTVYWDGERSSYQLRSDHTAAPVSITRKFSLPWAYNLAFFVALYVLCAWALILPAVLLGPHIVSGWPWEKDRAFFWILALMAIALTVLTVKLQIDSLPGGVNYLNTTQLSRHLAVLQGNAPNPWQYRVLSEYVVEGLIRAMKAMALPNAPAAAFISLRLLQNLAIFLTAFVLYRKVSASNLLALLGILILAASTGNSFYDNDLSFNTYFDVLAYLLCGLLVLSRAYYGIVILTAFAALNRETSGLIPFLMAAGVWEYNGQREVRKFLPVLLSIAVFVVVFLALHSLFPDRPLYIPYKHPPGFALFLYNLTRPFTWQQLFSTLGLAPLLGLAAFRSWPSLWQRFFLILCPAWFVVHFFASVVGETRLFLVPQALIFIPGVLFLLSVQAGSKDIV